MLYFRDVLTSYMVFPTLEANTQRTTAIDISIKPLQSEGLIFYVGYRASAPFRDFISLGLNDGFIEFRYDLGSGTAEIKSTERVKLYAWHTIHANRTGRDGETRFFRCCMPPWYMNIFRIPDCRWWGTRVRDKSWFIKPT